MLHMYINGKFHCFIIIVIVLILKNHKKKIKKYEGLNPPLTAPSIILVVISLKSSCLVCLSNPLQIA